MKRVLKVIIVISTMVFISQNLQAAPPTAGPGSVPGVNPLLTLEQKIDEERELREASDFALQENLDKLQELYRDTSCLEGRVVVGFDDEGGIICNDLIELNTPKWCPCFSVDDLNDDYSYPENWGGECIEMDDEVRSAISIVVGRLAFYTSWSERSEQGHCSITAFRKMPDGDLWGLVIIEDVTIYTHEVFELCRQAIWDSVPWREECSLKVDE